MDLAWGDLVVAFGLALIIEGLAYAAFARPLKRMVMEILALPETTIRAFGLAIAVAGLVLIWFVRG